jgi:hypothetical protein
MSWIHLVLDQRNKQNSFPGKKTLKGLLPFLHSSHVDQVSQQLLAEELSIETEGNYRVKKRVFHILLITQEALRFLNLCS